MSTTIGALIVLVFGIVSGVFGGRWIQKQETQDAVVGLGFALGGLAFAFGLN